MSKAEAVTRQYARQPAAPRKLSYRSIAEADYRRFVPETLVILLIVWLADSWWSRTGGSSGGAQIYWPAILLMSAHYGFLAGVFATFAAAIVVVFQGLPPQSATQDFYDYAAGIAMLPSVWLLTAMSVGGLRSFHAAYEVLLREEAERALRAADDLAGGLEQSVGELARLEKHIATELTTITALVNALSRLDMSDRSALLSSFTDVLRYGAGIRSAELYFGPEGARHRVLQIDDDRELPPDELVLAVADEITLTEAADAQRIALPLVLKVHSNERNETVGLLVCHRLHAGVELTIALDRLKCISRFLARLVHPVVDHD